MLLTASDLASITSHIHDWVLFLLRLHPFILPGVICPLISCSVLGTYGPGESLFQYLIILPFHTVHGGSQGKNTEVVCHSLLQWTTFYQICLQEVQQIRGLAFLLWPNSLHPQEISALNSLSEEA